MNRRVRAHGEVKRQPSRSRSESESEGGEAESCAADPNPRELAMARVKPGYDPVEARTHHCCKSGG
jgi:hypothetical protein